MPNHSAKPHVSLGRISPAVVPASKSTASPEKPPPPPQPQNTMEPADDRRAADGGSGSQSNGSGGDGFTLTVVRHINEREQLYSLYGREAPSPQLRDAWSLSNAILFTFH